MSADAVVIEVPDEVATVVREWKFKFDDLTFRGKRWGQGEGIPVIALHGWLDNCASFDFLAPRLKGLDILALDLAGQGKSDHRRHTGAYNIWLDIMEVIAVADQLGWKRFGLIGHSRGAMVSTLLAGTFPERVSHLALVEAFTPQIVEAKEAPIQMAAAIESLMQMRGRERSMFSSFDDAVKARERGLMKLCHEDAKALAIRGVLEEDGKFYWNYDVKLNAPSEVKFTYDQAKAFVDRIIPQIALIVAEDGIMGAFEKTQQLIEQTSNVHVSNLPGDHHLHMSRQCEAVADVFARYFAQ